MKKSPAPRFLGSRITLLKIGYRGWKGQESIGPAIQIIMLSQVFVPAHEVSSPHQILYNCIHIPYYLSNISSWMIYILFLIGATVSF